MCVRCVRTQNLSIGTLIFYLVTLTLEFDDDGNFGICLIWGICVS
jgi:hypothetical protein